MFKKIKNLFRNKDQEVKIHNEIKPFLHPSYNQQTNYNPNKRNSKSGNDNLYNDDYIKNMNDLIRYGDKQLEKLQKADKDFADGKIEEALSIYNKIIIEDGLLINSQHYCMLYLNNLYKLGQFDEAWRVVNMYTLKYPSLEKKCQEFRVRILKKEKRYKDALYHQILAILFDNIHYEQIEQDKYKNKYMMLLKKINQEENAKEIQNLINKYTNNRRYHHKEIKDDLEAIINKAE